MIGPDIPAHLLSGRSTTPDSEPEAGPSLPPTVGPSIPPELQKPVEQVQNKEEEEEDEDEDDYVPELPPDLAAARGGSSASTSRRVQGPSFPSGPPRPTYDSDDDDVGPMPLPAGYAFEEKDGVTEFLEREERRRKQAEVRPMARSSALISK